MSEIKPVVNTPAPRNCEFWTIEEVASWIGSLGFHEYRECFISNAVTGRKLIWIDANTLPQMGITNWNHIQLIAREVRRLLETEELYWNRSITQPHRCKKGLYLEQKSFTGRKADKLTFMS